VATGQAAPAWRTDGGMLYLAVSATGFLGSAPVTALRQVNLATGTQILVQPVDGFSFGGTLSGAFDGAVLFTTTRGVTAYDGTTGAELWSAAGTVPEGTDPAKGLLYLNRGGNLIAVNPLSGQVTATISGSAVNGPGGLYTVRDGEALGLDQGSGGDAWGYDVAAQRVTLAAGGLGWPHYFVDLSDVGGSADPASDLVVIAACTELAPSSPVTASPSATPSTTPTPTASGSTPTPTASGTASAPPATSSATATSTGPATSTPGQSATASTTPSPSPSPAPVQGCLRPELVALNL
jgi:hypothetical protein